MAIFSPAPSLVIKVQRKSITETSTHSQANQSPKRVYTVFSVRKSYGKFAAARMSGGNGRYIRPYGSIDAVYPLLVERMIQRRFSAARTRAMRKCCSAAAECPNQ